jgi:hypothetical protein
MQLLSMSRNLLRCKLIEGKYAGEKVLQPRITLCCDDPRLPFTLNRRQFPVIGAFAIQSGRCILGIKIIHTWTVECGFVKG